MNSIESVLPAGSKLVCGCLLCVMILWWIMGTVCIQTCGWGLERSLGQLNVSSCLRTNFSVLNCNTSFHIYLDLIYFICKLQHLPDAFLGLKFTI